MTFQNHVNPQPAVGVEGDFASANPNATVLQPTSSGGWKVAPNETVRIGWFAFGGSDGLVYGNSANAPAPFVVGFVGRTANIPGVQITTYLAESSMVMNAGQPVTLFDAGDFFADFAAGAAANAAVYATTATGQPTTTAGGNQATKFKVASAVAAPAVTDAATTIAADTGIMTVAAVASGVIVAGQRVTGGTVPANTIVTAQLTGAAGDAGTYQTNSLNRPAVAAFTATLVAGTKAKISSWQ